MFANCVRLLAMLAVVVSASTVFAGNPNGQQHQTRRYPTVQTLPTDQYYETTPSLKPYEPDQFQSKPYSTKLYAKPRFSQTQTQQQFQQSFQQKVHQYSKPYSTQQSTQQRFQQQFLPKLKDRGPMNESSHDLGEY